MPSSKLEYPTFKPLSRPYLGLKRAMDVVAAAILLLVTAPVWIYAAWRVRSEDGGPILYRGVRSGMHGEPFEILKFRTMVVDADRLGGPSTADDDPRLTKFGSVLRRWKLDELPQFCNVLKGQMSLVGPRPQVLSEVARYSEAERHLLDVRPGITDWASIRFRHEGAILVGHVDPDDAYDRLIRPEKVALGLKYVREANLRTDLRILVETVRCLRSGS